jgi:CheY-like chemotaxis protein
LLLADDTAINLKVGLSILQKLGYTADLAHNGLEVLQALSQKAYDLIFLDVQMPEMDGLQAAREIVKRWPADRRPVIVAMTGNALLGDRQKCLAAGMDDYVAKPIRVTQIQSILEHWGPLARGGTKAASSHQVKPAGEDLLDEEAIAALRSLPAKDGIPMLDEIIGLFLTNAPLLLEAIGNSLADPARLAQKAYALKCMSLDLGARRIVKLAQQLEDLGRTGIIHGAPLVFQELQAALAQTRAQLQCLQNP